MDLLTILYIKNEPGYYILTGIIALIVIISLIITKGLALRYLLDKNLKTWIKNILGFIHFTASIGIAVYLPNNVLNHEDYFSHLYEKNGLMIPMTMILIALFLFTLIGIVISLLSKSNPVNQDVIDSK